MYRLIKFEKICLLNHTSNFYKKLFKNYTKFINILYILNKFFKLSVIYVNVSIFRYQL